MSSRGPVIKETQAERAFKAGYEDGKREGIRVTLAAVDSALRALKACAKDDESQP